MSKVDDQISVNIACLDTLNIPATLISTTGYHCDVWRSTGIIVRDGSRVPIDVVIKLHRQPCTLRETRILYKEYRELKSRLDDIMPEALFVPTSIDGVENLVVTAKAITPWFNIANPINEQETIPLLRHLPQARLRHLPQARSQLRRFVEAARHWQEGTDRIIDLYGLDNLILDVNREIRYLDSFCVFFYGDVLYATDAEDETLREKIEISLQRRDYLEYVLTESRIARIPVLQF